MPFTICRSSTWAVLFSAVFFWAGYLRSDEAAGKKQVDSDRPAKAASDDEDALHHGALGVSLGENATGVRVIAVMPGSPAVRVGLRVGDEIRTVGSARVRNPHEVIEEIGEHRPGSQVELGILRGGERQTLRATLGSRESVYGRRYQANQPTNGGAGQMNEQHLATRLQALQQEVQRLEQEMGAVRAQGGTQPYAADNRQGNPAQDPRPYGSWGVYGPTMPEGKFHLRQWNYFQRHGEANDDPALFQ